MLSIKIKWRGIILLALIAAMSQNRVIGKNNQLPWCLPADLHHFKTITAGHPIVMGRKTYESIGHALPGRDNLVLTRQITYQAPHIRVIHSYQSILELATAKTVFIIGGSGLYQLFLPYAARIYLTVIEFCCEGDVFFPELDTTWQVASQTSGSPDLQNLLPYRFLVYEKQVTKKI
jgi:dihydrofolate reductase